MTADAFMMGSHMPGWLSRVDVPLFISHRRLRKYKTLPRARVPWCLDSGGFSELSMYGKWVTTPDEYVAAARRYQREIGNLVWCAPQDWMVEPAMRELTGLSVREHQLRTVESVVRLRSSAPDLPIIPVLQGWTLADYLACIKLYGQAGIDLRAERIVGLGSVCRRQSTDEIGLIAETLYMMGIKIHAFGAKTEGLRKYHQFLVSADSMAWSLNGRHIRPCQHRKSNPPASESNCLQHALSWRENVLSVLN